MAWTSPKTWVTNALVTAAELNTHLRDNLLVLKSIVSDQGTYRQGIAGGAAKTADYTATTSDGMVAFYSASALTLNLYASSGNGGRSLRVLNMGTGTVTVDPAGSESIHGASTLAVGASDAALLWCDGVNWWVLSFYAG